MKNITLKKWVEMAKKYDRQQRTIARCTPVKIRKDGMVTVVFWQDGTATSVRCGASESYDDYVAFCAALAKKFFLSNSMVKRVLKNTPVEYVGGDGPVDVDVEPLASDQIPVIWESYTLDISGVHVEDLH